MNKSQQVVKAYSMDNTVEAKLTEGINQANKLTLSVPLKDRLASNIFYALIPTDDRTNYLMFKLNDESIENDRITYTGIDAAYDELRGYAYIKEIRPVNRTAKEILQLILKDTRWEVGYIDSSTPTNTFFYYQSVLECIQQVVKLFNVEVTFTYSFNTKTHEITARNVNFYKQQGRRTGKRFEYGSNLLTVTREEDSQDIVTALVGRGKGEEKLDDDTGEATGGYGRRINFKEVVWSKANGDPTDKPAGQEYVENKEATKIFGYDDGTPRTGIVVFEDIEDPAELLKATWASLLSSCRPKVCFKASVTDVGDLRLGDTIAIIRHDLGIEYFTRVFKVVRDLKNEQNNTVEMGDDLSQKTLTSYVTDISNTANKAVQQANDAVVSAGSKNKTFYSATKPRIASEGDNLYLSLGNGEFEYWVWHNNQWEFVQSTQDVKNVEKNVQDAQKEIEQAKKDIITNRENANEAISTLTETVTGLKGQVLDGVNKSDFEALSNQINVKVSKGDVVSELNLEAGRALISSNKIVLDADSVIFNGKAFIPDAAISGISADKINTGTLDAGKINVININADNITSGSVIGANMELDLATGKFFSTNDKKESVSLYDGKMYFSAYKYWKDTSETYGCLAMYPFGVDDISGNGIDGMMEIEGTGGLFIHDKWITPHDVMTDYGWDYSGDGNLIMMTAHKKGFPKSNGIDIISNGYITIREGKADAKYGSDEYNDSARIMMQHVYFNGIPKSTIGLQAYQVSVDVGSDGGVSINGRTTVMGDFQVVGNKNAVVPTSKGMAAINAYETAEYYFGDIGKSKTDETMQVVIKLDPLFLETVNTEIPYHVFVSSYSDAHIWVEQISKDSFVVKSSKPNAEFSWEIKAKRLGYEDNRLKITQKDIPKELIPQYKEKGIM